MSASLDLARLDNELRRVEQEVDMALKKLYDLKGVLEKELRKLEELELQLARAQELLLAYSRGVYEDRYVRYTEFGAFRQLEMYERRDTSERGVLMHRVLEIYAGRIRLLKEKISRALAILNGIFPL